MTPKKTDTTKQKLKRPVFSFSDEEIRKRIQEVEAKDAQLSSKERLARLRKNAINLDDMDETR